MHSSVTISRDASSCERQHYKARTSKQWQKCTDTGFFPVSSTSSSPEQVSFSLSITPPIKRSLINASISCRHLCCHCHFYQMRRFVVNCDAPVTAGDIRCYVFHSVVSRFVGSAPPNPVGRLIGCAPFGLLPTQPVASASANESIRRHSDRHLTVNIHMFLK